LREVLERGWATDPKREQTMARVCETLAGANWSVVPGADGKEVAETEPELPTDPATVAACGARRCVKIEAEKGSVKGETRGNWH
jgi:hypothetical protein